MSHPPTRTGAEEPGPAWGSAPGESYAESYTRIRTLGAGSVGRVDLVRDKRDGVLYARKTVPLADEDRLGVLRREFRIRTRLLHPQVPAAIELDRDDERSLARLVVEYVDGEELSGAVRTLGPSSVPLLLAQSLNALGWLHRCGVIHGDVKPENLGVQGLRKGARPLVRLFDFGTALDLEQGDGEWLGGTPAYLAPYLKETGRPDPKTDLFALGRSFQDVLAGDLPGPDLPAVSAVSAVLERLVHPDPDLTYPSASEALADLLERIPALGEEPLPTPREPPFQGRKAERALLADRREALESGLLRESLLLLTGPQGIGKTRLLREFEREAILAGIRTFRLRCLPHAGPLDAVVELAARFLPDGHPLLERLARAVAPGPNPGDPERRADRSGVSQSLLRDLARAMKSQGAAQPVVIVIDDLEEADEPTLEFLRIFARQAAPRGPWIVAAANPSADDSQGSPLERLFAAGERVETCRIGPLPPADVRAMLAAYVPADQVESPRLDDWTMLSDGSPQLAIAIALSPPAPETGGSGAGTLCLDDLLRGRLRSRTESELRVLEALAVLERAAPLQILVQTSGLADPSVQVALDALLVAGLVEAEAHRNGRCYRLSSSTLGRHLVRSLAPDEARSLHDLALSAWRAWPFPVERPPDMLVRHALGAGRREVAVELGRSAIARLLSRGSLRTCEALTGELLPIVAADEEETRLELSCARAEAQLLSGRPGEARASVEAGLRSSGAAETSGDSSTSTVEALVHGSSVPVSLRTRVLRLLGTAAEAEGSLALALETLEGALAVSHDGGAAGERQRVYERLGALHYRLGDKAHARSLWIEGLRAERPDDGGRAKSELLNDLGALEWLEGNLAEADRRLTESLEIRRALGDLDGEARSLTNLASLSAYAGDLSKAAELYEEGLRLKRLVGTIPSLAVTLRNLGSLYRYQGAYGKAIACLEESVLLRVEIGDKSGEGATRRVLARLFSEKGEFDKAEDELELCRSLSEHEELSRESRAAMGEAEALSAMDLGRLEQARAHAEEGLSALADDERGASRAVLFRVRASARLAAGASLETVLFDLDAAAAAAETSGSLWEKGWTELELARAHLRHGDAARTREHLALAEDLGRRMGAARLLAEALITRFDVELDRGELANAAPRLIEAERIAARIGVPETQLSTWYRLGLHAKRCGFHARAVQWWRRAVELLVNLARRLPSRAAQRRFLALPEHRDVVAVLARSLAGRRVDPADPRPGDKVELERLSVGFLNDLLAQSEGFTVPGGGAGPTPVLRLEVLTRLLQISRAVNGMHHREEILAYLCDRLEELFGAENSKIILVGRDGAYRLMGESEETSKGKISRTLLERVLSERRPILVQDTSHDPELHGKSSVHRLGLSSVLCAPLIVDEEAIGVIQFEHRSKPGPFTEDDLQVLELFAHQSATALKNMLLVEQLDESIERIHASEGRLVAGERLRALGEMSAGVAHDFNNLLTIIVGITDLLRTSESLPEALEQDIETLETVAENAAATVRRLQEFRGISTSAEPRVRVDLVRVVRQAVELGRRRAGVQGRHEMRMEFEAVPPVIGLESELRDVLLNLIINAVEAMPKGGVVTIRARGEDGFSVIEVEDTGEGIDPKLSQRIFEPFFSTKPQGQGMGLSICWGIVRRMEGTIEAFPGRSGGTLFRLRFPPASAPSSFEIPSLAAQAKLSASNVLVVDDDPVVREVICRMLARAGFHPTGSADGRAALELFEREPFDLVLTDFAMPEMDGAEVARAIKRIRADCPVVLLTGRSPGIEAAAAEADTFSLVLRKPITTKKLAEALHLSRN